MTPPGASTLPAPTLTVLSSTSVRAVFSQALSSTTVNATNFTITPTLAVSSVALSSDGKTVSLTTGAQSASTNYTLTVKNVISADSVYSAGSAGITATFSGFSRAVLEQ